MMNKNDMIDKIKNVTYPIMTDAIEDKIIHHWAHNVEYQREGDDDGEMINGIKLGYFGGLTYTMSWADVWQSMAKLTEDKSINPHLRKRVADIMLEDEPASAYETDLIIQYTSFGYFL